MTGLSIGHGLDRGSGMIEMMWQVVGRGRLLLVGRRRGGRSGGNMVRCVKYVS